MEQRGYFWNDEGILYIHTHLSAKRTLYTDLRKVVVLSEVKRLGRWGFEVAECKECPALFPERHVKYYNDEYTNFQPHNNENPYPDMQFHRFGELCIYCRAPKFGEGNFVERLDEIGLREHVLAVGFHTDITTLVFEYYTNSTRTFAKPIGLHETHDLVRDGTRYGGFPQSYKVDDLLDVMAFPGVEHVSGKAGSIAIHLDMRWWRPIECNCTRVPFCECVCMAAQARNIASKLLLPKLRTIFESKHFVLGSNPTYFRLQNFNFLAILQVQYDTKRWNIMDNAYKDLPFGSQLDTWRPAKKEGFSADKWFGYCLSEETPEGRITFHTSDCDRRSFFRRLRSSTCVVDKATCGRCVDCRKKEDNMRKVIHYFSFMMVFLNCSEKEKKKRKASAGHGCENMSSTQSSPLLVHKLCALWFTCDN